MSHSQFHSTDLFILRHAWLNLWDKHMTTGRINQVSLQAAYSKAIAQSEEVFHLGHHKAFQLSALYCRVYTHFPQARPKKQVSRLT